MKASYMPCFVALSATAGLHFDVVVGGDPIRDRQWISAQKG